MPSISLARLCHRAILSQHLQDDNHVTLQEHLELLYTKMCSIGCEVHVETSEDLCISQAVEEYWKMSNFKLEVMSSSVCTACIAHPNGIGNDSRCRSCKLVFREYNYGKVDTPWKDKCSSRHSPY